MLRVSVLLLLLCILSACAIQGIDHTPVNQRPLLLMDKTLDQPPSRRAGKVIVITMTQTLHDELTGNGLVQGDNVSARYRTFLEDMFTQHGLVVLADWPLKSIGVRCLVFNMTKGKNINRIIAELEADERIETTQAMQEFSVLANQYDDPYLELQHGINELDVLPVHSWVTGKGVNVAVIDTGVDINHPDLNKAKITTMNLVNKDSEQFTTDIHGTAIAGVIAARPGNGQGMVGVAPDVDLIAIKGCWQHTPGYGGAICDSFTLAKSINWAIANKADIINLSLGGKRDPLLERLVKRAIEKEITVVGAVHPTIQDAFPINIDGVIPVDYRHRADVDNESNSLSYLQAPGKKVLSIRPSADYDFFSGSSLSTAHVSGVAALIRERKQHITANSIHALLKPIAAVDTTEPEASVNACHTIKKLINIQC